MNKVILTNAYLGKKGVDLKFSAGSGMAIASYSVAVPNYKKTGEEQTYTYINCITFNKQAEFLANNQGKIKKVGIEGKISTRNYDGKDGKKVYVTEIITENIEVEKWKNEENKGQQNNYDSSQDMTEIESNPDSIPF